MFGAESQADDRRAACRARAPDPLDQQSLTWCFAADHLPGEDHPIDKPADYERFRTLKLDCWPGPQFSWTVSDFVTHEPRERPLFVGETDADSLYDLWHARRIAVRRNFAPGTYRSDITLAQLAADGLLGRAGRRRLAGGGRRGTGEARQFTLSFFYWMQTEAPRHDGGHGYPGLRLRGDVLGTNDGLAKQAYYREGRRIRAEFTVLEQHIGVAARPGAGAAERFSDSVGIGAYRIDLHPEHARAATPSTSTLPVPDPARRAAARTGRQPAAGVQEPRHDAHHQRRLPGAPGGVEHRRGGGRAGGVRARAQRAASRSPRRPHLLADFQRTLTGLGVLLSWPDYGALTAVRRRGYRHST